MMTLVAKYRGLATLLIIYIALATLFSLSIPLSKAPDEYVHFLYIRFLIDNHRPPINLEEQAGAGYKSDQPPLYHGLVGALTAPIDASEPPSFKFSWEPPSRQLIDIVLSRTLLITTADETWPFKGLFLAWFAGRWVSIFLSSLTLILVYFTALEIFPTRRWLPFVIAGTLAFIPRFMIIGSVLSDDNMVGLLMALFTYGLVRLIKYHRRPLLIFALLGAVVGLALSTKYNVLPVPFEVLLITLWLAWRHRWPWRVTIARLTVFALALALTAAPWFAFMWTYFNQIAEHGLIMGLLKPIMAGGNNAQETAAILTTVSGGGVASVFAEGGPGDWVLFLFTQFWDVPIAGVSQPYPLPAILAIAAALCLIAVWGWRNWQRQTVAGERFWLVVLLLHLLIFVPIPFVRFIAIGDIHDTAQARHILFPAAAAVTILLAGGFVFAFPQHRQKWAGYSLVGLTFLLTLAHIFYYAVGFPPPLPVRTDPALVDAPQIDLSTEFADGLHLRGFDWRMTGDQTLDLTLQWEATASPRFDYRTEITLTPPGGEPSLRWLSQPAAGRLPTRAWDAGDFVTDVLQIPLVDLSSGKYQVTLRLLDWDDVPLASDAGEMVGLFTCNLDAAAPIGAPALWQNGRVAKLPAFRYRAAIPVTGVAGQEVSMIDPTGQTYLPSAISDGLTVFMVDYNWPSGAYRVQANGIDMPLNLAIDNFDWEFFPPEFAYPVDANFNDEIKLLGYDLPARRVQAGDGIPLVLYWQGLRRTANNYIIFDRLLAADQQAWGGYDRVPKETYPTYLWVPGEVVADGFAVPVDPDTPDGVYNMVIGLYDEADPEIRSLPLVQAGQPVGAANVTIGPIKVGGPPADAVVQNPQPENAVNVVLGGQITLLGYDVAGSTLNLEPETPNLELTLYWQAINLPDAVYSTFVHIRNEAGETVAQKDGPTGSGVYPTILWDGGETVADEIVVPLPPDLPPGVYHVVTGLYNPVTFERLSVGGNSNNELLLMKELILTNSDFTE